MVSVANIAKLFRLGRDRDILFKQVVIYKETDMSKESIVMYFGTTGRPGHHITMLSGNIPIKDQCRIGGEIDADDDLYSDMKKCKGIGYVYYRGVTMLCIPYSVHDSRGGSKSIFIMEGKVAKDEIVKELQKYSWVHAIFTRLQIDHHLDGVEEIELTLE